MNKYVCCLLTGCCLITSCIRPEAASDPVPDEIAFSASMGAFAVRATDTAFEQGDVIGLNAGTPVDVQNARLMLDGGRLTPETPIYWGIGQSPAQPVLFQAYYPYRSGADITQGFGFEIQVDQNSHERYTASDFMMASCFAAPAEQVVHLPFTHSLSKMLLTIDNKKGIDIADVFLGNIYGRAQVKAGTTPVATGSPGTVKAGKVTLSGSGTAWALILVPQTTAPRLMIVSKTGDQYTFEVPEALTFSSGKRYLASITIDSQTRLTEFTSEVSDWVDDGDIQFGQDPPGSPEVEFDVSDQLVFEALPESFSFTVSSDSDWTLEIEGASSIAAAPATRSHPAGISASISEGGPGTAVVSIALEANYALIERGFTLLFRGKKTVHTLKIKQQPRIYSIDGLMTIARLPEIDLRQAVSEAAPTRDDIVSLRVLGTLNKDDLYEIARLNKLVLLNLRDASVPEDFWVSYMQSLEYLYLPDNLTMLPNHALASNRNLKYVYGEGVKKICNNALSFCSALEDYYLPEVQTIEYDAFNRCSSLTTLVFPKATDIESYAFRGCSAVKRVSLESLMKLNQGVFSYDGPMEIEQLYLPNVRIVANGGFRGQQNLLSLELPSVVEIGYDIIQDSSIEEINFPVMETIPSGAFSGNTSLRRAFFESVKTVGASAFSACERLKDVYMPHAETLDPNAFYGCTLGGMLDFSAVKYIGSQCFAYSTGLGSYPVLFPLAVYIGPNAFENCSNLVAIQIPLAVIIGDLAFYRCTKLASVSPDNMLIATRLGSYAFYDCKSLFSLDFPQLSDLGTSCFSGSGLVDLGFGNLPWRSVDEYGFPMPPFEWWAFPIDNETSEKINLRINGVEPEPVDDDHHPWWRKEWDGSYSFLRHTWASVRPYK